MDPKYAKIIPIIFRLNKWIWAIQLAIGLPCLVAGYYLGKKPAKLIYSGYPTVGQVVDVQKISFKRKNTFSTTEYLPIIEFDLDGIKYRFTSTIIAHSNSTGYQVQVLVDKENPEVVMQDHPFVNWMPWSFFVLIGLVLTSAGFKSFAKRRV